MNTVASNVSKNINSTSTSGSTNYMLYIGIIFGAIVLILLAIFLPKYIKGGGSVSSDEQVDTVNALSSAVAGGTAQGFENQSDSYSESDSALINYNVLGCRLAGYLGPGIKKGEDSFGTFSEKFAVDKALEMGARVFVLDIDYLEDKPANPVLVARDLKGNLMSVAPEDSRDKGPFKNVGSIRKCTIAIADAIKASRNTDDPVICILSFLRIPGGNPRSAEGLRYLQEVYKMCEPLIPFILSSNINGTYMHRRKESDLFLSPKSYYKNSIIMLTNVDTTGFTLERMPDGVDLADGDLDKIIHARLYSSLDNSDLKLYELAKNGVVGSAYANTISYYMTIPQDKVGYESDITRKNWSIAMTPEFEDSTPDQKTLETLHNKLGVQCVPVNMFHVPNGAENKDKSIDIAKIPIFSLKWFKNTSFKLKPRDLQYEKPVVKTLETPSSQMNSGGGYAQTPSARNK
jgi:hypothetical protein